jgi:hypothetical protein
VFRTKDLNVLGVLRSSALRIGNHVIEVNVLFATALDAAALVSLPDFQLYSGSIQDKRSSAAKLTPGAKAQSISAA